MMSNPVSSYGLLFECSLSDILTSMLGYERHQFSMCRGVLLASFRSPMHDPSLRGQATPCIMLYEIQ